MKELFGGLVKAAIFCAAVLGVSSLLGASNASSSKKESSDSFGDGVTDALLGLGKRKFGNTDYDTGYNIWSDDE